MTEIFFETSFYHYRLLNLHVFLSEPMWFSPNVQILTAFNQDTDTLYSLYTLKNIQPSFWKYLTNAFLVPSFFMIL